MTMLIMAIAEDAAQSKSLVYYLLAAITALAGVVVVLYYSKEKAANTNKDEIMALNKEWTEKLEKIYESHKNDMKDAKDDLVAVIEKHHEFLEEIKDLITPRGNAGQN